MKVFAINSLVSSARGDALLIGWFKKVMEQHTHVTQTDRVLHYMVTDNFNQMTCKLASVFHQKK